MPESEGPEAKPARWAGKRSYIGWLAIVYWAALFVATHVPIPTLPMEAAGSDKVVHVVAFAGLGFLTALWLALDDRFVVRRLFGLLILLLAYAALDEWLQQFVNRHTDFADWVADAIGASLGVGCVLVVATVRSRNRERRRDFAKSPAGDYDMRDMRRRQEIAAGPSADDELSTKQH